MPTELINQQASPKPTPEINLSRATWGRRLAVVAALVFCISSVFPVVAGLSHDTESFPEWWGPLDVSIAFVLALLAFVVMGLTQGRVTKEAEEVSYRAYRILTHALMALLVVFLLFGNWIIWENCLTGFAWRAWLVLYSLPAWFTAFGTAASPRGFMGKPEVS